MTVKLVRTVEIAGIARTAGFDSIYIDVEHSSFSLDTTGQICMASLAVGITPFVRVPSIAPDFISRVLDGGALGVIAPHIQSPQDAARVVRAAKFPPLGDRSFTGSLPHFQFRTFPTTEMFEALNEATMVIVMIESAEALAAVDEIAAVDGVDMLFIGTNDLCSSLGIPGQLDHDSIRDAYARTIEACRRYGKHLGVGGLSAHPKLAGEFVKLGGRYVSTGTDLSFLLSAATARAKQMRDV
jgi:2-keto-3-deoxy-L-rhamnonate aldolase RhmA